MIDVVLIQHLFTYGICQSARVEDLSKSEYVSTVYLSPLFTLKYYRASLDMCTAWGCYREPLSDLELRFELKLVCSRSGQEAVNQDQQVLRAHRSHVIAVRLLAIDAGEARKRSRVGNSVSAMTAAQWQRQK